MKEVEEDTEWGTKRNNLRNVDNVVVISSKDEDGKSVHQVMLSSILGPNRHSTEELRVQTSSIKILEYQSSHDVWLLTRYNGKTRTASIWRNKYVS